MKKVQMSAKNKKCFPFIRYLCGLLTFCLLLSILPPSATIQAAAKEATVLTETSFDTRGYVVDEYGSVGWGVENVNFYVPGQTVLIDCYTIQEYNDSIYNIDGGGHLFSDNAGGYASMFYWAKKSFVDKQPEMLDYTAIIIENLDKSDDVEGDWAWFVNGVVSGDGIFRSNHSMINLAPKTDKGFILYIPTSQLNEENTPSKGDLVVSNFWIAQRDIIVGNDGWFYPDGDITGTEYHLDTLGTLYFVDRSVDDSVLDTAAGDYLNATVKIFDYDESVNTYDNGYYFWNGGYGQGADFESVDGWGAELITDGNGDLVFGNPYEGGNTTWDAYHGYNRNPNMSTSLSENGYPVILDKTPDENGIESGEAIALDYLFDGTYQVGRTMLGGGGLFQQDADGYFYYDSLQNAAYFDGTDFTLYSNLIVRPWANAQDSREEAYGNFLPLNELTKTNITRDGYIFNEARDTIVNSTHKPKGSLEAAGMSEVAALKVLESSGNHRLPERLVTDDVGTTLFDESTRITARLQDKVNLWFGMTVEFEFYQPKGGVIDTDNDDVDDPEDMIFDFHGDDDVLVYIGTWDDETGDYDYRLVLDISGAHEARSGHINFRTGDVTYETDGTDGTTAATPSASLTPQQKKVATINNNFFHCVF